MGILKKLFQAVKQNRFLTTALLLPFYFFRFMYHAIKERSSWFYRYYPGYHGSTIPSLKYVIANKDRLFRQADDANDGIEMNRESQQSLLRTFIQYYKEFSPSGAPSAGKLYSYENSMYGFNDAFILYSFLRHFKPGKVIEVGSGYSSALMLDVSNDFLPDTEFTFIDPYSTTIQDFLREKPAGNYQLIREEIQNIDFSIYSSLGSDDILFIDTSHVVKIGSDLSTLIFAVLPILQKGVIIHIHDIWHPWQYPEKMVREGCSYNEIYFVRAFLQFNKSFEILFYNSYMEDQYRDFIEENMPGYFKDTGKSLWLRKIT